MSRVNVESFKPDEAAARKLFDNVFEGVRGTYIINVDAFNSMLTQRNLNVRLVGGSYTPQIDREKLQFQKVAARG